MSAAATPGRHRASHTICGADSPMLREDHGPHRTLPCGCELHPFRIRYYQNCREDHGLTLPSCCPTACDNREGCVLRPPAEAA